MNTLTSNSYFMFSSFDSLSRNNIRSFLLSYVVSPFPLSSIGKEAPRMLCKRNWRTCTSMSDAESEDRASTVDDREAFEEDAG